MNLPEKALKEFNELWRKHLDREAGIQETNHKAKKTLSVLQNILTENKE